MPIIDNVVKNITSEQDFNLFKKDSKLEVVGISEYKISQDPSTILITYSLGSCVGITIFDKRLLIGGLIHCMLPLSTNDPMKAKEKPAMFVDTGLTLILNEFFKMGSQKKDLIIKLAGGSNLLDTNNVFNIGDRNVAVVKKILWKNSILLAKEDIGNNKPRTMSLIIATGQTFIKSKEEYYEL